MAAKKMTAEDILKYEAKSSAPSTCIRLSRATLALLVEDAQDESDAVFDMEVNEVNAYIQITIQQGRKSEVRQCKPSSPIKEELCLVELLREKLKAAAPLEKCNKKASSHLCCGTTLKGDPCQRKVIKGNYCHSHS